MDWVRLRPWMWCCRATLVAYSVGFLFLLFYYGTRTPGGAPEIIDRTAGRRKLLHELGIDRDVFSDTRARVPRKGPSDPDRTAAGAITTMRTGLETCSTTDVVVYQGATAPLPNGIPTYTVEILNVCVSGCSVGDIHVSCGWFSSARLVNPRVFRRLRFDDCLVNNGAPLAPGQSLSFQYANTYRYPLVVSSLSCV